MIQHPILLSINPGLKTLQSMSWQHCLHALQNLFFYFKRVLLFWSR
jgi:hypothetical protein